MVRILSLHPDKIRRLLRSGSVNLAVVGLGYVGLPLAVLFASEGAKVMGTDVRKELIEQLMKGECPIMERDVNDLIRFGGKLLNLRCPTCSVLLVELKGETFCPHCMRVAEVLDGLVRLSTRASKTADITSTKDRGLQTLLKKVVTEGSLKFTGSTTDASSQADVVIITVGTPIDAENRPNYDALISASKEIGRSLTYDALVILKSTVSPGTTEDLVGRILEDESRLKLRKDFGLAHMPERVLEGFALLEFRTLPRIVAGVDERSTRAAASVFSIFPAPIYEFSNPKITEAAKLFENIYRDVNIALANELARICEAIGVDVIDAIEAARTDPKTNILIPGPGVGGYCLTKDTYHLAYPSIQSGIVPELILLARRVNDSMPRHIVDLVKDVFQEMKRSISGADITVLGLAFKGNTGDLRSTPAASIVNGLLKMGANVTVHDPLVELEEALKIVPGARIKQDLEEAVYNAVCITVATDHNEYRNLSAAYLLKNAKSLRAIVDTRHVFNPREIVKAGLKYRGVGHPTPISL